jgi:hypothetical protein
MIKTHEDPSRALHVGGDDCVEALLEVRKCLMKPETT